MGTKHRNHCPACLWSRHLDRSTPGDRLSDCRSRMQPLGLAFKHLRWHAYGAQPGGELMLVHRCLSCGHVSCNRIAGDDNPYLLTTLLDEKAKLDSTVMNKLDDMRIQLLTCADRQAVMLCLFGMHYRQYDDAPQC